MEVAKTSLDDGKAEGIVVIPLIGKTSIADYMIIASGRSNRQVAALTMNLAEELKEAGAKGITIEGMPRADWVLVDAKDIIVHLFRPEVRSFYNLEKMWGVELPPEVLVKGYSVDSDSLTDAEAEEDWDEEAGESPRF
ncbi:MAG: ribosome silencing factor [Elstera sp.]